MDVWHRSRRWARGGSWFEQNLKKKKKKVLHQTECAPQGKRGGLRGLGDLNPENFYLRSRGAASTPPSLTQPQGAREGLQPFMTHKRLLRIILRIARLGGLGEVMKVYHQCCGIRLVIPPWECVEALADIHTTRVRISVNERRVAGDGEGWGLKGTARQDSLLEPATVLLHKDELTQAGMTALALKW